MLKENNLRKALEGRKIQTRSKSRYQLKVGKIYPVKSQYFEKAKTWAVITRKFKQRLGDISLKDMQKEGFDSFEEFQAAWIHAYGSWHPEEVVTVYEFKPVVSRRVAGNDQAGIEPQKQSKTE